MKNSRVKQDLIAIFGERVAFHRTERQLYSSDVGFLPPIARSQIKTLPDAVAQPVSADEVKSLINLAEKYSIPLVPRGGATSGYGGAVPVHAGIVVDFTRMNAITDIDPVGMTIKAGAGTRWNDLEKELRRNGLALRLYPGSAISATVGGWIANGGGVGIGSYEYGYLQDNLAEVEIVTPAGTRKLSGSEMELANGLAGTTGFIISATIRVRESDADVPVMASFSNLEDITALIGDLKKDKLPLWEAGFRDPIHVRLTHDAVRKQTNQFDGHGEIKDGAQLNEGYIALFVYPGRRETQVKDRLLAMIGSHGGRALDDKLAAAEWDERFFPLRLKALGPSVVPSEVDIPADKLPAFISAFKQSAGDFAYNGTLIKNGERTTVLTYAPGDERRFGFMFSYAGSFGALKAATKLGGRPYAIGTYLTDWSEGYFGREALKRLFTARQQADPGAILNPGKVFPRLLDKKAPFRLGFLLRMAGSMGGLVRLAGKLFNGSTPQKFRDSRTQIGKLPYGKVAAWDAYACVRCGYCSSVCTEYKAIGWEGASPRGKFHFLRDYLEGKAKFDERMGELFYACTTCGHCNEICQINSHIEEHWTLTGRQSAWLDGYNPPRVSQVAASHILLRHNPGGMSQEKRTGWRPPGLKTSEEGEIAYWVGCNASFNQEMRNLPVNSIRILNKAGIEPVYLGTEEWCCGGGVYAAGCTGEVEETVRHNIDELIRRGVKTVISSCGSCYYYIGHLYPLLARQFGIKYEIQVKHINDVMDELISAGKLTPKFPVKFSVTFHDPCHQACAGGIVDQPRRVLAAIPGLQVTEMSHHGKDTLCCGRHSLRYPRYGGSINSARLAEAAATGVPALISSCPTCETNFRLGIKSGGKRMEVFDITDLVAESLGLPTLVVAKINKVLKGADQQGERQEPAGGFLSDEELAKEEQMFSPQVEAYAELQSRKGSIKIISEELGESADTASVPKSC